MVSNQKKLVTSRSWAAKTNCRKALLPSPTSAFLWRRNLSNVPRVWGIWLGPTSKASLKDMEPLSCEKTSNTFWCYARGVKRLDVVGGRHCWASLRCPKPSPHNSWLCIQTCSVCTKYICLHRGSISWECITTRQKFLYCLRIVLSLLTMVSLHGEHFLEIFHNLLISGWHVTGCRIPYAKSIQIPKLVWIFLNWEANVVHLNGMDNNICAATIENPAKMRRKQHQSLCEWDRAGFFHQSPMEVQTNKNLNWKSIRVAWWICQLEVSDQGNFAGPFWRGLLR